jgi:hypothetical protein
MNLSSKAKEFARDHRGHGLPTVLMTEKHNYSGQVSEDGTVLIYPTHGDYDGFEGLTLYCEFCRKSSQTFRASEIEVMWM